VAMACQEGPFRNFCHSKGDLSIMEWHGGKDFSCGFNGWTHLVHSMCGWL